MLLNKKNYFEDLGYMVDCSRGAVPKISSLKKLVDILSSFGYNYLMLYTEDTYELDGEPYFGYMRGRYSKQEIKELDLYCQEKGMELRACIQTLAHLGRLKRHSSYTSLFEIDNILTVKDEKVYAFIDKMLSGISKLFTSKKVHIGMDEAWALGRGKFLDQNGIVPKTQIMSYHLERVAKIAASYGLECDIWADMLCEAYNECEDKQNFKLDIPSNITPIIWRYWVKSKEASTEEFELYQKITKNKMGYAGGAQKWSGFVPENTYSFLALKEQIESCIQFNVKRYLVTAWADGAADASLFSTLPAIYYASLLAHQLPLDIKAKQYFKEVTGMAFRSFMKIDALSRLDSTKDEHCFNNLSFIYLYNDLFQGLYDEAVLENSQKLFHNIALSLKKNITHPQYGYLFLPLYDLAKIDELKASLGKEIYQHYQKKDILSLKKDIRKTKRVLLLLEKFMEDYEVQWHVENKSFGFEKQIIRLGGLKERLHYVIRQLNRYVHKKIDSIEELEEEHLKISSNYWDHDNPKNSSHHNYCEIVSSGSLLDI